MSDAHREDSGVASLPCPVCAYELAGTQGSRCPECGSAYDRAALTQRVSPRIPGAALMVMLCFILGTLPLTGIAVVLTGVFEAKWLLCVVVPYSAMLVPLGKAGTAAGFILAALQGPVYGVLLGLAWPPRKRWRVWVAVGIVHAIAAAIALLVV